MSGSIEVTCQCKVSVSDSLTATIELYVGVPVQGDIRELATDRWQQMYPG